ncbi:hypothetical protein TCAL_07837 [Tigriopus californicus]|uniref:Uncharacterized protein n=1 Tax=Tigriopus californicus TaxID=6832 RepID=A0A553PJG1_TIGCA|nr:ABC transporter G family member 20-like [Tigriopus californicus]TRY77830.1 hypothetical protein TCAL_07837 [Tigriopus californicus]|eukprot:TCALIF_07837-PA protein Name:"Similar to abcG20 ABC transporter G family member 20 (Dictyostelium discoideum)" AED:0.01 eAED:0.01 QI:111/1/0.5/1/1/1/2/0/716
MDIVFDNVCLSYGRGKKRFSALKGVSLRVDRGTIYGLVGPSGSGKTSILSCCLDLNQPDSGSVSIAGKNPGDQDLGIPGPTVGYMPQELSVHAFFNPREILHYYGQIFNVQELDSRVTTVLGLLNLDRDGLEQRQISFLSGGQKRRVSLACAMVHNPRLLILDEPTVGVDPLLRRAIWTELNILATSGTTVLITTHYLQEVASASKVGFLRDGRMLVEDDPQKLMSQRNETSLEKIFLDLCLVEDPSPSLLSFSVESGDAFELKPLSCGSASSFGSSNKPQPTQEREELVVNPSFGSVLKPLIRKNMKILQRHTVLLSFQAILPLLTYIMFLVCIGRPLHGLDLGVVNEESACDPQERTNLTCLSMDLQMVLDRDYSLGEDVSCHVIVNLDPHIFHLKHFQSFETAKESVILGKAHGFVQFPSDFSIGLEQRIATLIDMDNVHGVDILNQARIFVYMDASSVKVLASLQEHLLLSLQKFFHQYGESCHLEPLIRMVSSPGIALHSLNPEFRHNDYDLSELMFPGMMTLLLNLLPMALTADQLMTDKEAGLLLRDFVCRVPFSAVIFTQIICQLVVVIVQLVSSLILVVVLFPTTSFGVILFAGFLLFLQACCGMALGAFICSLCRSRDQVIQVGMAVVMPAFIVSGILWPRSTMPQVLQVISAVIPTTFACDIMKSIILNNTVLVNGLWKAILLPLVGTVTFFFACLFMVSRVGIK